MCFHHDSGNGGGEVVASFTAGFKNLCIRTISCLLIKQRRHKEANYFLKVTHLVNSRTKTRIQVKKI